LIEVRRVVGDERFTAWLREEFLASDDAGAETLRRLMGETLLWPDGGSK
jgi:hypothetical protein